MGSGDVQLRTEPKSIDVSIRGSGEVIHPDGRTEDRHHSYERHASAEDLAIHAAVQNAMAQDGDESDADLERAKARLKPASRPAWRGNWTAPISGVIRTSRPGSPNCRGNSR